METVGLPLFPPIFSTPYYDFDPAKLPTEASTSREQNLKYIYEIS
jgi:hypothetical protein